MMMMMVLEDSGTKRSGFVMSGDFYGIVLTEYSYRLGLCLEFPPLSGIHSQPIHRAL